MKIDSKLRRLGLFTDMPDKDIDLLLSSVPFTEKHFHRGAVVLVQGEHYTHLHILIDGSAYSEMVDASGKAVRIEAFDAPAVLAPGVIYGTDNDMPGSVIASTGCRLLVLHRDQLSALFGSYPQFRENYLRLVSDRFVFISKRMSYLSFTTIKGKIAQYLLTLDGHSTGSVTLHRKIEELAGYFGAARPSVSRAFAELEQDGIISKKRSHVEILDEGQLKDLLS